MDADRYSGILSGILSISIRHIFNSYILSDIYVAIRIWHFIWHSVLLSIWHFFWAFFLSFHLAFYLTFYLTSFLAFYLTYVLTQHSIWHSIRHPIWHIFWHSICHSFWQPTWHLFWHSFWIFLACVWARCVPRLSRSSLWRGGCGYLMILMLVVLSVLVVTDKEWKQLLKWRNLPGIAISAGASGAADGDAEPEAPEVGRDGLMLGQRTWQEIA